MKNILFFMNDFSDVSKYRNELSGLNIDHRASHQESKLYLKKKETDLIVVKFDSLKIKRKEMIEILSLSKSGVKILVITSPKTSKKVFAELDRDNIFLACEEECHQNDNFERIVKSILYENNDEKESDTVSVEEDDF